MKILLLLLVAPLLSAQGEDDASKAGRAGALVVAGKVEEAILLYQDLAREHPVDVGILLDLSIAEFKARRYRDAANHAGVAVKLKPDSPAANLFLGSSYVELGEHSLALEPLQKVLAAQPRERNARLMLAEAFLSLERYEEAAAQFQNVSELAPENPKVWYGLGRTFDALSEKVFHRLEQEYPESPYWHALEADLYLKQRRYGNAFTHYRHALEGDALLPGVHAGLATIYNRTGHATWAEIETQRERRITLDCSSEGLACDFAKGRFREIIRTGSLLRTPEAQYWTCKAFAAMGQESYGRLLRLPASLEAHMYKAKILDDQGLARDAAAEWREALQQLPGDVRIETSLAWSLFRGHELLAALPVVTELLQSRHSSRELLFLQGAILVNLDEPEKAIAPLEAAIRLDDRFLPAHAALGQALLQISKPELAVAHLKAALPADDDASVHFGLFRAYQRTGQSGLAAQAKVEYQNALRMVETKDRLEEGGTITAP